jgi:hypothetical protein
MFNSQQLRRVVHGAVAVTVVANRAVKQVIAENPIERLALRFTRCTGIRSYTQAWRYSSGAGPHEFAVNLNHTRVAGLNWTKLRVIANVS